mmetsp:Transcript_88852/g.237818  ORF Transcript_88852/g.237818 Transcript_88852/m.237818 type:complete len:203 (-) Transcript_88852:131-739(-)
MPDALIHLRALTWGSRSMPGMQPLLGSELQLFCRTPPKLGRSAGTEFGQRRQEGWQRFAHASPRRRSTLEPPDRWLQTVSHANFQRLDFAPRSALGLTHGPRYSRPVAAASRTAPCRAQGLEDPRHTLPRQTAISALYHPSRSAPNPSAGEPGVATSAGHPKHFERPHSVQKAAAPMVTDAAQTLAQLLSHRADSGRTQSLA